MSPCFHCYAKFEDAGRRWCDCIRPLRTLVCPACHRCFCTAPFPYKHKFWSERAARAARGAGTVRTRFGCPARVVADASAPLVLIVDDDEAIRSLVACRVAQLGYRVAVTEDPHHALMMARSRDVSVVLTDALMPHMDGRELCSRLKMTDEGASKKVIVMTSLYKARRYADEAMLRYQADAYITKPVDFSQLEDLLGQFAPLAQRAAMAS